MDPLSITASAIAIGGFAASIGKGIKTLKALGKIPDEFCALLNELTMLQMVARGLDDIDRPSSELDMLRNDLAQTVKKLQDLVKRFETSSKGLDNQGRHRIPRLQWTRERSNIESLREQARQTRDYITSYLATLNRSESFQQSSLLLEIKGFTTVSSDNLLATVGEMARTAESRFRNIEDTLDNVTRLQAEAINYYRARNHVDQHEKWGLISDYEVPSTNNNPHHDSGNGALSARGQKPGSSTAVERAQTHHSSYTTEPPPPKESILCLQAVLRCQLTCRCRCHRPTNIETPTYLRGVVGAFFLSYNSSATFGGGGCNYAKCSGSSASRVKFSYYLPSWIASCAVQFAASWGSLRNEGAVLSLRIPRVLPDYSAILRYIRMGDVEHVQKQFSSKRNFPTDVFYNGESFLLVAMARNKWDMVDFLIRAGSDVSVTSKAGISAVSMAKEGLFLRDSDKQALSTFQRIVELGGDDHTSTAIHDSILGLNDLPIETAIEMEPDSLNVSDSLRNTPLHWAVQLNDHRALEALLSANADIKVLDTRLRTPLHLAATVGNLKMVTRFLDAGSDPSAKDVDGKTPLHLAVRSHRGRSVDVVRLLLQRGSDPNAPTTSNGESPLNYLASEGSRWMSNSQYHREAAMKKIELLLNAGADIDQLNYFHRSPLLNAIDLCHKSWLVEALHTRGARLDIVDKGGHSVLHLAAFRGGIELTEYLMRLPTLDLDTEAMDSKGYTPLACIRWRLKIPPGVRAFGMVNATWKKVAAFEALLREIRKRQEREGILLDSLELRSMWEREELEYRPE